MTEQAASSSARSRGKRKGPRPKHQPQRTCIACRDKTAKRGLIRVVRTPDGSVVVDPGGKANGRGAYLCENPDCWRRALTSNSIEYALKVSLDADTKSRLRDFADQIAPLTTDEAAQSEGEKNT
ncbi:MAG: RNase P modulator RnpM [Thermomicrobiales bacterium]